MALRVGYNFIRGEALQQFLNDYAGRYPDEGPAEAISAIWFLRHVRHSKPFPNMCVLVRGFENLWLHSDDPEATSRMIHDILYKARNWLQNGQYQIYFQLSAETTFNPGPKLELRLRNGQYVNLARPFGTLEEVSTKHYHKSFNIDSW